MKAFQLADYRIQVLGNRHYGFLLYDHLFGYDDVFTIKDFEDSADPDWVDSRMPELTDLRAWLSLEYRGVPVGRFVIASTLRRMRTGRLDFASPAIQSELKRGLDASVRNTLAGEQLLTTIRPDCAAFFDCGYSPQGEISALAISRGIDTITWQFGYKSNQLVFKRYNRGNSREHPHSLSEESWRSITSMPWSREFGDAVRHELFDCYKSQDWYSVVSTQLDKHMLPRDETCRLLGLSAERKIAVIFPHILWDGSFFWGSDLFDDYTEWLVETIRAACANERLQWIVKLHPAHVVKANQDAVKRKPSEAEVLDRTFGKLPSHVQLVYPDCKLSTYSLFEVADYAVTVRGTVGVEAALFGIPVVTAGTGRYAHRGFTLDSSSKEEYLARLARLETFPRLSEGQVELAERYAYALFFCRPFRLESASLTFERDGRATPRVTIHCQTREDWFRAADMRALATWIRDGKTEDMLNFHRSPHLNRTPSADAGNHDTPARCGTEPANVSRAE